MSGLVTGTYGGHGWALLRALVAQGRTTFDVSEARRVVTAELGGKSSYVNPLLHHLEKDGLLRRIKRGTYAVAGVPGMAPQHPFATAMALATPSAISGWSALSHHGLTEQIPHVVTLTTTKKVVTPSMRGLSSTSTPGVWEIGTERFEIVTVVPRHFFGHELVWVGESQVSIFDRERAVLDCFALPRRFGGLAEGMALVQEKTEIFDVAKLVGYAAQYGEASVAKRVGLALEEAGVSAKLLEPLLKMPVSGSRLLDPTRSPFGDTNRRWKIRDNRRGKPR